MLSLFLPCAAGVEPYLETEVASILGRKPSYTDQEAMGSLHSGSATKAVRGGVMVQGNWQDMMQLNLKCRLAQRVLIQVSRTPYGKEQDLYDAAYEVAWEVWFSNQRTIRVDTTAQHSPLKSLNFAALKIKDAVVDRLRTKTGARPSVDTHFPDVRIHAHLSIDRLTLYIDTSGEPLFKRGWRADKGDAPLKETLAAAMLHACGWVESVQEGNPLPLYDPCCGSGTILIEAAQILCGMPAGAMRRFGFEKLIAHQGLKWREVQQAAQESSEATQTLLEGRMVSLFGSDVSFRMVDFAQRNAVRAGVEHALDFRGGDALERMPPCAQPGILLLNPPYGERIEAAGKSRTLSLSKREQVNRHESEAPLSHKNGSSLPLGREQPLDGQEGGVFFERLASHWKRHFVGWSAWLLTPDAKLPNRMRLRESRRIPMWNGPIECRLMRFDMSAGRHGLTRGTVETRSHSD